MLATSHERTPDLPRVTRRRKKLSGEGVACPSVNLLSSSSSAWRLQQIDAAQIDDDDMAFWTVNPKMVKGRLRTRVLGNF
jgi:hypothetical protein